MSMCEHAHVSCKHVSTTYVPSAHAPSIHKLSAHSSLLPSVRKLSANVPSLLHMCQVHMGRVRTRVARMSRVCRS